MLPAHCWIIHHNVVVGPSPYGDGVRPKGNGLPRQRSGLEVEEGGWSLRRGTRHGLTTHHCGYAFPGGLLGPELHGYSLLGGNRLKLGSSVRWRDPLSEDPPAKVRQAHDQGNGGAHEADVAHGVVVGHGDVDADPEHRQRETRQHR